MGVKGDLAKIALTAPACAHAKDKVALSRRIDKHWRLVGEFQQRENGRPADPEADYVPSLR